MATFRVDEKQSWLSQEEVDALIRGVSEPPTPPPKFSFMHKLKMYGRNINIIEANDEVVDYVRENYKEHEDWAYGYGKRNLYISDDLYLILVMKFG